jgi:hypothetical protein
MKPCDRFGLLVPALVLAGWLAGAPEVRADQPLERELSEAARKIAGYLRPRSDRVALGTFQCNSTEAPATNAGAGIYLILRRELEALAVRIDPEARFVVSGSYRPIVDASSLPKQMAIKLEIRLALRGSARGFELAINRAVVDEATFAEMLGLTVALGPEGDETQRKEELQKQAEKKSPPHVEKGWVFSTEKSPYGLELLVKRDGTYEPSPIRIEEGLAYVELKRDDVYAVRLINNSDHEAAVRLSIDGLELFSFSSAKMATLILKPHTTGLVKGWPRTFNKSNEFVLTEYAKSAVAQLKSTGAVGVVSAGFSAAWPKKGTPPADEPKKATRGSVPTDATGHGAPVEEKYVPIERTVGVLRSTVTIRYAK